MIRALVLIIVLTASFAVGCQRAQETTSTTGVRVPVLYIDMDGTLLNPHHEIRPATLEAIRRYKACGGNIGLATGRSLYHAKRYFPQVKATLPIALYNGAMIVKPDGSDFLSVEAMPIKAYREALEAIKGLDVDIQGIVVETKNDRLIDRDDEKFAAVLRSFDLSDYTVDPTLTPRAGEDPIKILLIPYENDIAPIAKKLNEKLGDKVAVLPTHLSIDIVPKGINKAVAIKRALKDTGFDIGRDVYVIGDSGNDVAMLEEAAYGFAMKNCRPSACKAADAIIGPNDSDAIANLINHVAISPKCTAK